MIFRQSFFFIHLYALSAMIFFHAVILWIYNLNCICHNYHFRFTVLCRIIHVIFIFICWGSEAGHIKLMQLTCQLWIFNCKNITWCRWVINFGKLITEIMIRWQFSVHAAVSSYIFQETASVEMEPQSVISSVNREALTMEVSVIVRSK